MLHPARRMWRDEEVECRLTYLEQALCGHERQGDVPGFEIPSRYFHYVRSGDARPLAAVLEHNRLDIVSLAMLTARASQMLDEGPSAATTSREACGMGRLYERAGLLEQALACFQRARTVDAMRAAALLLRRLRRYEEAAYAWRELIAMRGCPAAYSREAMEALAVHHEHRARDLETARDFALQSLQWPTTAARQQAVKYRLARLDRKLGSGTCSIPF
jgi:tetratricopeptide (TPR) repeat protein